MNCPDEGELLGPNPSPSQNNKPLTSHRESFPSRPTRTMTLREDDPLAMEGRYAYAQLQESSVDRKATRPGAIGETYINKASAINDFHHLDIIKAKKRPLRTTIMQS